LAEAEVFIKWAVINEQRTIYVFKKSQTAEATMNNLAFNNLALKKYVS